MNLEDIMIIRAELKSFNRHLDELQACSSSAKKDKSLCGKHYTEYGYDTGFINHYPSKRRGALKRASLSLRRELLRLTK